MNSSSSARTWAPGLDLTAEGLGRFDPARVQDAIDHGYETGLAAGRAAAIEAAQADAEVEIARLRVRADSLMVSIAEVAERLGEHEADTAAVFARAAATAAATLAEAIIRRELSDDTRRAAAAMERVLTGLDRGHAARVRLHPDDAAMLGGSDLPPNVAIEPDPSLRPGDAVAHTDDRTVDARIATAIDRARAILEAGA